jgi:hypothetical protein
MVDPFLFLMKDVHDCHLPSSKSYLSDKTDQNEKCVAKVVLRRVSTPFVFHIHDFTVLFSRRSMLLLPLTLVFHSHRAAW